MCPSHIKNDYFSNITAFQLELDTQKKMHVPGSACLTPCEKYLCCLTNRHKKQIPCPGHLDITEDACISVTKQTLFW